MHRASLILLLVAAAFLTVATAASAARPFWWWTPAQANVAVKTLAPRMVGKPKLPVLTATCRGYGATTVGRYRAFRCFVLYSKPDGLRAYDSVRSLHIRTSTRARGRVACWGWSSDEDALAGPCPRSGDVTALLPEQP